MAGHAASDQCVQIHTIAAKQQIPEDYLRQLLVNLRLAGLVKSVRGPHGGYMLARPPSDITMGEVLDVLEGPPDTMHCRQIEEDGPPCQIHGACNIRGRWNRAVAAMQKVLHETTLADLISEQLLD